MGGPVDDDMANLIVAQLLYLDSVSPSKAITMYVNSPGGSVTAGRPTLLSFPAMPGPDMHFFGRTAFESTYPAMGMSGCGLGQVSATRVQWSSSPHSRGASSFDVMLIGVGN